MAIVKQISFKEKERELFEYANNRGNFSEYIKALIMADMTGLVIPKAAVILDKKLDTAQLEEEKQSDFILEAERDDLEL